MPLSGYGYTYFGKNLRKTLFGVQVRPFAQRFQLKLAPVDTQLSLAPDSTLIRINSRSIANWKVKNSNMVLTLPTLKLSTKKLRIKLISTSTSLHILQNILNITTLSKRAPFSILGFLKNCLAKNSETFRGDKSWGVE